MKRPLVSKNESSGHESSSYVVTHITSFLTAVHNNSYLCREPFFHFIRKHLATLFRRTFGTPLAPTCKHCWAPAQVRISAPLQPPLDPSSCPSKTKEKCGERAPTLNLATCAPTILTTNINFSPFLAKFNPNWGLVHGMYYFITWFITLLIG